MSVCVCVCVCVLLQPLRTLVAVIRLKNQQSLDPSKFGHFVHVQSQLFLYYLTLGERAGKSKTVIKFNEAQAH